MIGLGEVIHARCLPQAQCTASISPINSIYCCNSEAGPRSQLGQRVASVYSLDDTLNITPLSVLSKGESVRPSRLPHPQVRISTAWSMEQPYLASAVPLPPEGWGAFLASALNRGALRSSSSSSFFTCKITKALGGEMTCSSSHIASRHSQPRTQSSVPQASACFFCCPPPQYLPPPLLTPLQISWRWPLPSGICHDCQPRCPCLPVRAELDQPVGERMGFSANEALNQPNPHSLAL